MDNNLRPPGWGVAAPRYDAESDSEDSGRIEIASGATDDSGSDAGTDLRQYFESSSEDSNGPSRPKKRRKTRKREREQRRRERREERREDREERREARRRREEAERASVAKAASEATGITSLWKQWAMPKLRDDMTHDEMRLEWPIWRDMLVKALELQSPAGRQWTEEEKHMTLMMFGGRHVRETAAYTTPVAGENVRGGREFSDLITRCNVTYQARDPTTEITYLRNMIQGEKESVREFLEKARKQISLCGYNTGEERDRELVMLIKQNTIDAMTISRHGFGQGLAQIEELAINLEAVRKREEHAKPREKAKQPEPEVDVHAVLGKWNQWGENNQPRASGYQRPQASETRPMKRERKDCEHCGRSGGHEANWKCKALTSQCYKCGRTGHLAAVCRQVNPNREQASGSGRGQRGSNVNQVSTSGGTRSANPDGWGDDWDV